MSRPMILLFAAGIAIALQTASAQAPAPPAIHGGAPSISPDGSKIAFLAERDGATDVFVIGADGTRRGAPDAHARRGEPARMVGGWNADLVHRVRRRREPDLLDRPGRRGSQAPRDRSGPGDADVAGWQDDPLLDRELDVDEVVRLEPRRLRRAAAHGRQRRRLGRALVAGREADRLRGQGRGRPPADLRRERRRIGPAAGEPARAPDLREQMPAWSPDGSQARRAGGHEEGARAHLDRGRRDRRRAASSPRTPRPTRTKCRPGFRTASASPSRATARAAWRSG